MRALSKLIRTALFVSAVLSLTLAGGRAQKSSATKRLLFLYWYDRNYPSNVRFDQSFRGALRSISHGTIDYYAEYLETNRFRSESQSRLLHDYLRQKYAGLSIDVLVTNTPPTLDFFLKYHSDLFPNAPIVFATTEFPAAEQLVSGPGATGFVYLKSHRENLDLALKLHPETEQVFIVSGADPIDTTGRKELQGYPRKVAINYLTDLPLEELLIRVKSLPERSLVLYVRQQLSDRLGKLLESQDVLAWIARSSRVPIYGMVETNVGLGIIGGYVFTSDGNAAKLAELAVRVANGARPADIPVQKAPYVPMFDWRQLQRWNIPEDRLPPGSIIRFREVTFWQQYKWRIVATVAIVVLQAFLIVALLVQRKRAQGAQRVLQESEERFRRMADTAPTMIWVFDPDQRCTFLNRAWLTFTGRKLKQELGDAWMESVHADDRDSVCRAFSSAFQRMAPFQLEYRLRRADGEYRFLLCNGVPRHHSDKAFAGYIGSCVDITDLKEAQERALDGQRLELIGMLANGVAHDFNNLLGGILASTELALSEIAENAGCEEELLQIRAAAGLGAQIVREVMTFGRQDTSAFAPVDCAQLIREITQVFKVSVSKSAILKTELAGDIGMVHGNPAQLQQLLMNLVVNASQAIGDQKGEVTVRAKRIAPEQRTVPEHAVNRPDGEFVLLEVSDTGPGMSDDIKARIFDPFFTTKLGGRGLGLAIAQGVVSVHGGTIEVVSAPGLGTTFKILFPCLPKREVLTDRRGGEKSSTEKAAEQQLLEPRTVLIIEDEKLLRTGVATMLRKRGLTVIEAEDGNTGVDLFITDRQRIDVVLLDMTLPGKPGAVVLQELQRVDPKVRVIVTSAYGREHVNDLLNGLCPSGYIQKPYRRAEVEAVLRISRINRNDPIQCGSRDADTN